jgi:hypothetical protein
MNYRPWPIETIRATNRFWDPGGLEPPEMSRFGKGKKTMVEVLKPTIFKFFLMDDIWMTYG